MMLYAKPSKAGRTALYGTKEQPLSLKFRTQLQNHKMSSQKINSQTNAIIRSSVGVTKTTREIDLHKPESKISRSYAASADMVPPAYPLTTTQPRTLTKNQKKKAMPILPANQNPKKATESAKRAPPPLARESGKKNKQVDSDRSFEESRTMRTDEVNPPYPMEPTTPMMQVATPLEHQPMSKIQESRDLGQSKVEKVGKDKNAVQYQRFPGHRNKRGLYGSARQNYRAHVQKEARGF